MLFKCSSLVNTTWHSYCIREESINILWSSLSTMDIGQTQRLLIQLHCMCSIVSCAAHQQFNLILLVTLWCMPSHSTTTTQYQPIGWLKDNRLPTWKLGYDIGIPCCDVCFLLVSSKWSPALLVITWLPQSWRCLSQHNGILNHCQDFLAHGEDHLLPLFREMENALCNSGICGYYAKDVLCINGGSLTSPYNSLLPNSIVLWQIWPDICHGTR